MTGAHCILGHADAHTHPSASNSLPGTPLGDPIEVNAAVAALPGAIRLSAAKARVGHAEPAAGAVGLLQAAAQLSAHSVHPLVGLARVNAHVAACLADLPRGQPAPVLAREGAGRAERLGGVACGVSAFAFQGTNAHAVLDRGPGGEGAPTPSSATPWMRERHWFGPAALLLSSSVRPRPDNMLRFRLEVGAARAAYLLDHRVAGRCVLPAAAMLEGMAAAVVPGYNAGIAVNVFVERLSISAPLMLHPGGGMEVGVDVDVARAGMQLASRTAAGGGGTQLHATSQAGELGLFFFVGFA